MDLKDLQACLRFVDVKGKKRLQVATGWTLKDGEAVPGQWEDVEQVTSDVESNG